MSKIRNCEVNFERVARGNIMIIFFFAGDFSVLCSVISPRGERWMSGDFLAPDRILVWSDEGKGYLYKLPAK